MIIKYFYILIFAILLISCHSIGYFYIFELSESNSISPVHIKIKDLDIYTELNSRAVWLKINNQRDDVIEINISKCFIKDRTKKHELVESKRRKNIRIQPNETVFFRLFRKDIKVLFQESSTINKREFDNIVSNIGNKVKLILIINNEALELNYELVYILKPEPSSIY